MAQTMVGRATWDSRLRETAASKAIALAISLANRMSDDGVDRALGLMESLAPSQFARRQVAAVRRHWRGETAGGYALFRRVLREVDPGVQQRLAEILVVKHHWQGGQKRTLLRQQGIVVPFTILISPTMRCNLRCFGCYAGEYSQKDDLPAEVMDRVLAEGKELGVHMVTLLGGEPLVYGPLLNLLAKHHDVAFMLYTNATLVDEDLAHRLLDLGNVVPIISLEGFAEETDARRGKGAFQRAVRAMDVLREHRVPFGFSAMVTSRNIDTVASDEFNDFLIEKGCLLGWHFLYMPVGRDPDVSLMPTPAQRERLRRLGAARIRTEKPLFIGDFWNDAPWVGGCIAGGRQYVHINSRGDVEPCIFCHFATDNVKDKSLLDCLQSGFFKAMQALQPYDGNLLRPCMMIDHPHVFRRLHEEFKPYPTHPGAEELVRSLVPVLDRYSQEAGQILDRVWQEEYAARGFTVPIGW